MRIRPASLLFLLFAMLVSARPARPAVIHVPGDQALVQDAADAAVDGDTVLVAPGDYDEEVSIEGKQISLLSEAGAEKTWIQRLDAQTVPSPGLTIEGFTFDYVHLYRVEGLFRANIVTSMSSIGLYCSQCSDDLVITSNRFVGSTDEAQSPEKSAHSGAGIFLTDSHPRITNNVFRGNIQAAYPRKGGAIYLHTTADGTARIVNNTFEGNGAETGGALYQYGGSVFFANNIVTRSTAGGGIYVEDVSAHLALSHNIYWDNKGPDVWGQATADPTDIFAAPLITTDGHLQTGSPCIDAGSAAATGLPDTDRDGDARPLGDGFDIGADEYDPANPYPPEDYDGDGSLDPEDNCPDVPNLGQANSDGDAWGDACDNCPASPNEGQRDRDGDKVGDTCDNCPASRNPDQADNDADGMGDACDPDDDNDGLPDQEDNCPWTYSPFGRDADWDGYGNACDNCPLDYNPDQEDLDEDGTGDACDPDMDGDALLNEEDNCPLTANPEQEDQDGDAWGDVCDLCPAIPAPYNDDKDRDGVGDVCDNCPDEPNADQGDLDEDGMGNACDPDADGDGHYAGRQDCDDENPDINVSARETPGDGIDANCNGVDACFIATAAFGSSLEPRIDVLRAFRDQVLVKSRAGRWLVDFYYAKSPPLARLIERHPLVQAVVRVLLFPVIGLAATLT